MAGRSLDTALDFVTSGSEGAVYFAACDGSYLAVLKECCWRPVGGFFRGRPGNKCSINGQGFKKWASTSGWEFIEFDNDKPAPNPMQKNLPAMPRPGC